MNYHHHEPRRNLLCEPKNEKSSSANEESTTEARIRAAFAEAAHPKSLVKHPYLSLACVAFSLALAVGYLMARTDVYSATSSMLMGNVASASDRLAIVSATGDIEDLTFKLFAVRVQHFRLESERKGAADFSIPSDLTNQASSSQYKSAIEREQQLFLGHTQGFAVELENLRQQVDLYRQALNSRARQVDFATTQQQSIDRKVSAIRKLVKMGISSEVRLGDVERLAAAVGSLKIDVEAERIGLAQNVLTTEQEIRKAKSNRDRQLLSSLQQSAIEMHGIETRLATARLLQSPTFTQPRTLASIEDVIAIIQSEATAFVMVDAHNLATEAFIHHNRPNTFSLASWLGSQAEAQGVSVRNTAARIVQQGLHATRAGRGSRIDVTFVSRDPEAARLVANGVAGIFSTAKYEPTGAASRPAEIVQRAIPQRSSLSEVSVMALGLLGGVALAILCSMAASLAGILKRNGQFAYSGASIKSKSARVSPWHRRPTSISDVRWPD